MRITPPSAGVLAAALLLTVAGSAPAQDAATITRLQDAVIRARGSTISIRRLPIETPTGRVFRDVVIELHADAQGRVSVVTAGPAAAAPPVAAVSGQTRLAVQSVPSGQPTQAELPQKVSAPIVMQIFRAGTYSAADGGLVRVQDRGNDLVHHLPAWSLSTDANATLGDALWWSGPPEMNPKSARLRRAEITGTEYAYGVSNAGNSEMFGTGSLIGVAQQGNTLRIVSFHHGCCSDQETPAASITYTYVGP